ncbi:MAG: phosphoribosylformylglycinamidine synthase subunit PurQ [Nitrospinae bacterium]|nr:phosphoribosylformylglycinamidine synthase subunit PurQ [Nitrospinota bacterium]
MKCGIVVFPGSNCDHDCYHILKHVLQLDTQWIWHKDKTLDTFDFIVLPGGFSYGDYLRPGAIARFSPIMKSVIDYANRGGRLLGICNGFQILVESGLLPGVLMDNAGQKFICKNLTLRVDNNQTPFTSQCTAGEVLKIPINHGQGRYYADDETLKRLVDNDQIVFRYCDAEGNTPETANPNGSLDHIAGVANQAKNVMGMMPHPERCADPLWPEVDGQTIFNSLIQSSLTPS